MASAFLGFISQLPPRHVDRVYNSPHACLAVLRSLPELAKHYCMRLMYVEGGVPSIDMDEWVTDLGRDAHAESVRRMRELRVMLPLEDVTGAAGDGESLGLNPKFQRGMRSIMEGGGFGDGFDDDDAATASDLGSALPSPEDLESYAKGRWEALLLTLTGASDAFVVSDGDRGGSAIAKKKGAGGGKKGKAAAGANAADLDVGALFRAAGLIGDASKGEKEGVTEAGFKFLLSTAREQIWALLVRYIERYAPGGTAGGSAGTEAAPMTIDDDDDDGGDDDGDANPNAQDAPAVLSFLLKLTFQAPGVAYSTDGLPASQKGVVRDVAKLGLLYPLAAAGKGYYVPTSLSSGLSGGGGGDDDGDGGVGGGGKKSGDGGGVGARGHIIVETNFRVYAYTSSAVEVEILRLFTRPDYKLPNLYVGMMTREAVVTALRGGISAEQIVSYLRKHAHPQARKTPGPAIPATVCDQIRLWSKDENRVKYTPCVLYCDFPTGTGMFEKVAEIAKERGLYLWGDPVGLKLAVREEGHESMKDVFKKIRAGEL